ncbi:MAG: O-antigen ligase family protein [Ilumatobacteraceae bacterium]|nr:O-antigen ligase family protein [Ilumatobacteraceae bacterium]
MAAAGPSPVRRLSGLADPIMDEQRQLDGHDGTELWIRLSRFSLVLALVDGYGAYVELFTNYRPSAYAVLQVGLVVGILLVAPRGQYRKLIIPLPGLLYGVWWMLSSTWTNFPAGFVTANSADVANVTVLVVVGLLVPLRFLLRNILTAGYIAVALIGVALIVQPSLAFSSQTSGAPVPGLHGAFIHKNIMGSCIILTAVAVLCFERRRWIRLTALPTVAVLLALSQSGSSIATLVIVVIGYWLVAKRDEFVRLIGRSSASFAAIAVILGVVILGFGLGQITAALGKDLTFSGRDKVWAGAIKMIKRRPIEGYGGQNLFVILSLEPARSINYPLGFTVRHVHNGALETLLRLGLVGLSLFVAQMFTTMRSGLILLRSESTKALGRFIVLLIVVIVAFGVSEIHTAFGVYLGLMILFGSKIVGATNTDQAWEST